MVESAGSCGCRVGREEDRLVVFSWREMSGGPFDRQLQTGEAGSLMPWVVYESGGGRPGWASCHSGWLSRWTYVVCLCRPLTLVVDGIAATEEGSEVCSQLRRTLGRRLCGDRQGVRAWISRLVLRGSQSETMCRKDREASLTDLEHKGKVRGR